MKTLVLIRHAKSDWNDPSLRDFDRPLNERGKRDAPVMAQRLLDRGLRIGAILSSPARRAAKTARVFAEAAGIKKDKIIYLEELYLAEPEAFYRAVEQAPDKKDCIAVFSHNPGITEFANEMTDARIDNIPTCGMFAVRVNTGTWESFRAAEKEFLFFDYPKAEV